MSPDISAPTITEYLLNMDKYLPRPKIGNALSPSSLNMKLFTADILVYEGWCLIP